MIKEWEKEEIENKRREMEREVRSQRKKPRKDKVNWIKTSDFQTASVIHKN